MNKRETIGYTIEQVDLTNPHWSQLIFCFVPYFSQKVQKKALKSPATSSALALKICFYDFPYIQGQLTEVPLNFNIFAIKVVGQTIQPYSTKEISKLQSNGIIRLGLVNFFMLYYSLIISPAFKVDSELVPDVQFQNIDGQLASKIVLKIFSCDHK